MGSAVLRRLTRVNMVYVYGANLRIMFFEAGGPSKRQIERPSDKGIRVLVASKATLMYCTQRGDRGLRRNSCMQAASDK